MGRALQAVVIRGTSVLARPQGTPGGPIPTLDEIKQFATVIESFDYGDLRVITSSTGTPPPGWRWVSLTELQTEAGDDGDKIGEAMLCG